MKCKIVLLLSLLLVILCCGCSVTEKRDDPVVTEQTDPGLSAIFKNSPTTVKNNRFENDDMRIWRQNDDDGNSIWMQEKLDGTDKKQIPFGKFFLWLTNDWIYYYTMQSQSSSQRAHYKICRIPLDHQEATYRTEEKEVLFEDDLGMFLETEFIVTDQCIIYGACRYPKEVGETITYYRYDFQTKKKNEQFSVELVEDLPEGDEWYYGIYNDVSGNLPVTLGNDFFVGGREGVFRVPFDTLEPVKIYSGEAVNHIYLFMNEEKEDNSHQTDNLMVAHNGGVYFTVTGKEIMKYEEGSESADYVLEEKELRSILENMKLWDEDYQEDAFSIIEGLRLWNDRLYLNVTGIWSRTATDGRVYSGEREVLLSAELTNLKEWKLEDALSEYILENAICDYLYYWSRDNYLNYYSDHVSLSPKKLTEENKKTLSRECYLYDMGDGKILLAYCSFSPKKVPNGSDGVEKELLYDLDTGKFLPLDKDNYTPYYQWLWRAVSYNRPWPEYYDESMN
ncbi:MAG: hypothetical protein K2K70_10555 [Lachnospiraceae bacterium]|nr:hypothetical protein [Lachnospiraceae bacterium]